MNRPGERGDGGRNEARTSGRPLRPSSGRNAVEVFAEDLQRLRTEAKLTLEQLAARANYSKAALSRATSGERMPSWGVTKAYVLGCGGDEKLWRVRWEQDTQKPGDQPSKETDKPDETEQSSSGGEPSADKAGGAGSGTPRLPVAPWFRRHRRVSVTVASAVVLALTAWAVIAGVKGANSDPPAEPDVTAEAAASPWTPPDTHTPCKWDVNQDPDAKNAVRIASSADKLVPLQELADKNFKGLQIDGRCIGIKVEEANSGEMARHMAAESWEPEWTPRPDVWSPASTLWLALARQWAKDPQKQALPSDEHPPLVATSPLVIAVPRDKAGRLGWTPDNPTITWQDFNKLAREPDDWGGRRRGDDWGPFTLGKTNPTLSTSGLNTAVGQMAGASHTHEPDPAVLNDLDLLKDQEKAVAHYGDTTLSFLANLYADPERSDLSAVAIEESSMVSFNRGYPCGARNNLPQCALQSPPTPPLVALYPAEGTLYSDHPYYLMPGRDSAKTAAAQDFLKLVQSKEGVQELAQYGFRDHQHRVSEHVTSDNGAWREWKPKELAHPDGEVLDKLLWLWPQIRKPANVLLVVDISGSMAPLGPDNPGGYPENYKGRGKLEKVQDAAQDIANAFTDRDKVGVWSFSSELGDLDGDDTKDYRVDLDLGLVRPVAEGRERIVKAIKNSVPGGGTGLFDTVKEAATHLREHYDPGAINAVAVLSDGMDADPYPPRRAQRTGEVPETGEA